MEMKNICGKIPVELHEKLKLEVEELGISIPKYLEMVIEEHMTRKGEKTDMANSRTGRCFHFRLRGECFKEGRNPVPDAGFSLRA